MNQIRSPERGGNRKPWMNVWFRCLWASRWRWCVGRRAWGWPWLTETWRPCSWRRRRDRFCPSSSCRSSPSPQRANGWASSSGWEKPPAASKPSARFIFHKVTDVFSSMQDESTGEITFYMKGADVAMASIVQYNDWLEEEVGTSFILSYAAPHVLRVLTSEPHVLLWFFGSQSNIFMRLAEEKMKCFETLLLCKTSPAQTACRTVYFYQVWTMNQPWLVDMV